jgi:stage III sporulation protein AE
MLLLSSICVKIAQASSGEEMTKDYDYTEIQEVIDDVLGGGNEFDFNDYTSRLINGEEPFSFKGIGSQLLKSIKGEIKANISTFVSLVTIALIAALFTNLSMAFKNNQVSETGYYITYLL